MENDDEARRRRAEARKNWPVRFFPLGQEPGDDLSATTTASERVAMVWTLTQDAWAAAGRPIPTYSRAETPIRFIPSPVPPEVEPES